MSANAEIIAELRRVLNERDEARHERDSYQRQLDAIGDAIVTSITKRIEPRISRHPVTVVMAAGSLIAKIGEAIGCEFEDGDDLLEAVKELARERDEARASCPDCAMWAERSTRWHDGMQRAERERDEARASLAQIRRVFGNAIAFDDARGDIVKMAEIAYRGACDGDKAVGELRDMTRQRDEARAEVERLQETKDYLRTWLSSEELEGLRVKAAEHPLLWEEIHHLKDEVERLRVELIRAGSRECDIAACNCGTWHHQSPRAAYRRGAEAMREACARWFREHDESFELTVDACHDVIADMPIPEEP